MNSADQSKVVWLQHSPQNSVESPCVVETGPRAHSHTQVSVKRDSQPINFQTFPWDIGGIRKSFNSSQRRLKQLQVLELSPPERGCISLEGLPPTCAFLK